MRTVALVEDFSPGFVWWRILRPFAYLRAHGYEAETCWLEDGIPLINIDGATVILQRTYIKHGNDTAPNLFIENLRKLGAARIVYDLDDNILTEDYATYIRGCGDIAKASLDMITHERKCVADMIKLCDDIVVTNKALAKVVFDTTGRAVRIVPNAIDINWFNKTIAPTTEQVLIGWAGARRPEIDIEAMVKAWKYICEKYPHVMFVVGGFQPNLIYELLPYERIIRRPARRIEEWPDVIQVDIGCSPLDDNGYNRCKSPIRFFEYSLAGAAVIASDVVYGDVIRQDVSGCLISNNNAVDEWIFYLEELIENLALRKTFVNNAITDVQEKYSLDANWRQWVWE